MTRRSLSRLVVAALLVAGLAAPAGAEAQAKGKGKPKKAKPVPSSTAFFQRTPAQVPDRAPGATAFVGLLDSPIVVGRRYKGRRIVDVDAGVSVTGPAGQLDDIELYLRSPDGATVFLTGDNVGAATNTSYGLGNCEGGATTFTDETENFISDGSPPATFPGTVFSPWANFVQPDGFPLSVMDGGPARGTWTMRVVDDQNTQNFVLDCWRLSIRTAPKK